MPRGDGAGPMGMGPMNGRGMGMCAGNKAGRSYGCGQGRGMGRGFNPQANSLAQPQKDELTLLKNQASAVENHLNNIKGRISELEKE